MSELSILEHSSPQEVLRLLSAVSASTLPNSMPRMKHEDIDPAKLNALIREIKEKLNIPQDDSSEKNQSRFLEFISDEISKVSLSGSNEGNIEERLERKKIKIELGRTIRSYISNDKSIKWISGVALGFSALAVTNGSRYIGSAISEATQKSTPTFVEAMIAVSNIVLAGVVLIFNYKLRAQTFADQQIAATKTFKQILFGWNALWITWILFYGCLYFVWTGGLGTDSLVALHLPNAANLLNGYFFYYMFFALDQPSVKIEGEPDRAKSFRQNYLIVFAIGVVLFFVASVSSTGTNSAISRQLCSAYIAVGMSFFFGRLDSHYLTLPRVVLAPLYFYAIIQVYWGSPAFDNFSVFNPERIAIFGLALGLKFVLFVIIYKLLKSDDFREYLVVAEKGKKVKRPLRRR